MPQYDLSPDQLALHTTETVEPDDFDDFWADAIGEAENPDHSGAPTFREVTTLLRELHVFDVTFPGSGGDEIRGWLVLPRGTREPLGCVVTYLGYGSGRGTPSSWTVLPSAGIAQFVMDTRGQGGHFLAGATADPHGSGPHAAGFTTSGIQSPHDHYYRRVYVDAVRAIDAAAGHPAVDPGRIAVAGESQGGAIALAAAGLSDRVRAVAADVPFLSDIRRAVRIAAEGPYLEMARYMSAHGDDEALRTLAYFDVALHAARITAPALLSVGLMDRVCPPSTVYAAFNAITAPREMKVYPYSGHEHGRDRQVDERLAFFDHQLAVGTTDGGHHDEQ